MNALVKIPKACPFDQSVADSIIELIADGESLGAACEALHVDRRSVNRWLVNVDSFAQSYARARLVKADTLADDVVPLADSALGMDSAGVQAVKNMVDARKWAASKFNPSAYGDKLDVTSKGEALAAPSHQVDARVQSIVMQAAMRMRDGLDPEIAGLLE